MEEDEDEFAGAGLTNCPRCLVPLDLVGPDDEPYLQCPVCKLIQMTG